MFTHMTIHMIGIGGISMSGIAEILLSYDCKVTGYDMSKSQITDHLSKLGIEVNYSANLKNIENADVIVYTAAIKETNEELKYARSLNKEIYERSTFLGLLMKNYKNVLCISGTHGKSTTSGMVSTIFVNANINPTIQIGAMLPIINGNNKVGTKDFFIAEACEYVDSFLSFFPTCEVILNIDDDHLDYFKNIDNIIYSFNRYTHLLPVDGHLIVNADDNNSLMAAKDIKNKITFGIENDASYRAKNINYNNDGFPNYDLYIDNVFKYNITLSVRGKHNIYNSLAATACSTIYIKDLNIIKKSLESYTGVGRRFEYLGKYYNTYIYDDYAHHPSEIKTTFDSVQNTKHNKSWAIFQGHTYSRTYEHMNEFASILSKFDNVIVAPIYAARETNDLNVKEETLVELIKETNPNVIFLDSFDKIVNYIKENVKDKDLVITIGAGPINEVAKKILEK